VERDGIELCVSSFLGGESRLAHGFTLRSYNVSLRAGPDWAGSAARRRRLCDVLGLDFGRLTGAAQVHGAEVIPVDAGLAGAGRDSEHPPIPHVDGMVTDQPGIGLICMSADCPLILAWDPGRRALGLAHSGWRGTLANIAARLVSQMQRSYHARPASLAVGIPPCAGPDRYQVQQDVLRIVETRWQDPSSILVVHGDRTCLDLRAAIVAQLTAAGVDPQRIDVADTCTISDERFCSFRRDGPDTGHAGLVVSDVS
jgi:YfiH family protein